MKDRRAHRRYDARFDLHGRPEGGAGARMIASNLSAGGLYCSSPIDYPEMTRLAVRLLLPANGSAAPTHPVEAEAVVVRRERIVSDDGLAQFELALFFTRMEDDARRAIATYLERRG